jgi:hypothetical protein
MAYLYDQIIAGIGNGGIDPSLFPVEVSEKFFQEYFKLTPLNTLIGTEPTRPIVRRVMQPGQGLKWEVGKLENLDYKNPSVDFDDRDGVEQQITMFSDSVGARKKTQQVKFTGEEILRFGTPVNVFNRASMLLMNACKMNLNWDLFNSMLYTSYQTSNGAYNNLLTGNCNVSGTLPSYDRMIMPIANGSNITRAAYQANSTFPTVCNALQTPTATTYQGSGLSCNHLSQLKMLAQRGNASDLPSNTENLIQPALIRTKGGWGVDEFYYFAHPETIASLESDPKFANSTLYRGTVTDADQPETISGADYRGKFNGIHIYAVKDLFDYAFTSADGNKRIAINLFMGAAAVELGWAKEPSLGQKIDSKNDIHYFWTHELRGQKMLQFPSKYGTGGALTTAGAPITPVTGSNTVVEQGIAYSFVSY